MEVFVVIFFGIVGGVAILGTIDMFYQLYKNNKNDKRTSRTKKTRTN